jgi:agmatinase
MPGHNLFGLEGQTYEAAKVVVLPIPYDSTTTYKTGSREGPDAIINASRNMELYSYELKSDVSKIGIYTLPALAPDMSSPENMVASIKKEVGIIIGDGKLPLLLGGEHTVTIGALQALKERGRNVSVIQFDAHSDSRTEMFNSRFTHATVAARAREIFPSVFQVGIRSIDGDSAATINSEEVLFMDEIRSQSIEETANAISEATNETVYVTIDLDVLDPSEMPSVGTPEPDGLRFNELMQIIKGIAERKELAGLDVVELCPIPYMHAPDYLAAKLTYLTLGHFLMNKQ